MTNTNQIVGGVGAAISMTKDRFEEVNPVIPLGVTAYETDTRRYKIGDGITPYIKLLYTSGDVQFAGRGKMLCGAKIPGYIPD